MRAVYSEADENMCFIKVVLEDGFYYNKGKGYTVDFVSQKAECFPFEMDIVEINER